MSPTPKIQAAIDEKRSLYQKNVKNPLEHTVLKSAEFNNKLGKGKKIIQKGAWKGFPLFYLTLEEYATCPTCIHHDDCYGLKMRFAHRFKHGLMLQNKLNVELRELFQKYDKIAIRLHVLGNFYSESYIKFWQNKLKQYPGLHIFGYTAHWQDKVFDEIKLTRKLYPDRFIIRFSQNKEYKGGLNMFACDEDFKGTSLVCPEQQDKTESCLTCGLCFSNNVKTTIKFLTH